VSDPKPAWDYHAVVGGVLEACDRFAAHEAAALDDVEARARQAGGDPVLARQLHRTLAQQLAACAPLAALILDETTP
jgi:hypothetical protein